MTRSTDRKAEHLYVSTTKDVEAERSAGWEDIHFAHECLPEINKDEIDLSVDFLGKHLNYPLVIAALTGGHPDGARINQTLAKAAERLGLVMEVGSQRALIESPDLAWTYRIAREAAPNALLICQYWRPPQLIDQKG